MTSYAILLRGINVGAHNRLKMALLVQTLSDAGLDNVRTHIQSGNIRASTSRTESELRAVVEDCLKSLGIAQPKMAILPWPALEQLTLDKPYHGYGADHRCLALFPCRPLANASSYVGRHGLMTVIGADSAVIFTVALKEDTPGMKGMDNLEKLHKTPTTGRFWNVIEDWVRIESSKCDDSGR